MLVIYVNSRLNRRRGGQGRERPATVAWRQFPALLSIPAVEKRVLSRNTGKYKFQIRPIVGIYNCSQMHECRNWEQGRTVSFLGIYVSNFRYSVCSSEALNLEIGFYPRICIEAATHRCIIQAGLPSSPSSQILFSL
jgi:hypothetical protein